MGRRPKLRVSFNDDAAYLLRLAKSINDDPSLPVEWAAETHEMVMALARRFLSESAPKRTELPAKKRRRAISNQ